MKILVTGANGQLGSELKEVRNTHADCPGEAKLRPSIHSCNPLIR